MTLVICQGKAGVSLPGRQAGVIERPFVRPGRLEGAIWNAWEALESHLGTSGSSGSVGSRKLFVKSGRQRRSIWTAREARRPLRKDSVLREGL